MAVLHNNGITMAKFTFEQACQILTAAETQHPSIAGFVNRLVQHIKSHDANLQRYLIGIEPSDFCSSEEVYAWFYQNFVGEPTCYRAMRF